MWFKFENVVVGKIVVAEFFIVLRNICSDTTMKRYDK